MRLTSPRGLLRVVGLLLAVCATLWWPRPARAAGGWETWLYPGFTTDLIATHDEVWCAMREGGLLRWDRARGAFDAYQREPGSIASNAITSLALDRSGRLWAGTGDAGVSRLRADRSGWDLVNRFDGLPSDSVTTLLAVGDTVWIGTKHGLALWNGTLVTGSLPDGNTVSFDTTFHDVAVTGIVQLGDTLWMSTHDGVGFARLSTGLQDWQPAQTGIDPTRFDIEDLASDGRDLLAVSVGYAYSYNWGTRAWQFRLGNAITAQSSRGMVFVCSDTAVHRWDGSTLVPLPGSPRPIPKPSDGVKDYLRAAQDPAGLVFAGTANTLYEQVPSGPWAPHVVESPPDNSIVNFSLRGSELYLTALGGIGRFDSRGWRGWFSGINCFLPGCDPDTTFRNGNYPFGLLADSQGRTWVGCWSSALETFTDAGNPPAFTRMFVPVSGSDIYDESRTWVYATTEDHSGGLWFGMDSPQFPDVQPLGVLSFDAAGNYLTNWDSDNSTMSGSLVRALVTDKLDRVWIGYQGQGVDFFTPPGVSATSFSPLNAMSGQIVRGMAAYGESLWVLTPTDVRRFSIRAGSTTAAAETLLVNGGQTDLGLRPIDVAPDGSLWIATARGLSHVRRDGSSERFTSADSPLASDAVSAVAVDPLSGKVWIGTAAGLHRYDPAYVSPPTPTIDQLSVRVYPNPVTQTGIGPELYLTGDASAYEGTIFDVFGHRVRDFSVSGNGVLFWDGRDRDGSLVRPGVYFVRVRAGGRDATTRFVLLR